MSPNFPISFTREEFEKFNAEANVVGVYTEIIIDAPPSEVKSNFLDFESRVNWDPFHRKIEVSNGTLEGDCDDLELTLTLDMNMNDKASKFFMPLSVNANDHESFIWGLVLSPCGFGIFRADHANLFLAADETGNATRFVQYERMADFVAKLAFDEDTLLNAYTAVNEALKKVCEEAS
mmetsp:Transcript_11310/g.28591  ORF Transcript_11310/g.28591 Transcript_11310/m.28591 type:complete len:178 (+) Transcript_11310:133-666(+)|eukprot:CAMPEP_0116102422 /NCGR_PEP_ID=MMETSP0327-20121206/13340_1 /TAXON_ID=44447 /ORGANISM="Pseudo-nitzschia delicatissima, Strain B596" /LENGTH=177 /DNA_ID=CAMNT_0003594459 /DNA_START=108 /DNA_END=641 /DNA_ORIENTATION=+